VKKRERKEKGVRTYNPAKTGGRQGNDFRKSSWGEGVKSLMSKEKQVHQW